MNANIDFVKDINERYCSLEYELEKRLKTMYDLWSFFFVIKLTFFLSWLIFSEAAETKFESLNASDGKSITNEFDSCPSSLEEARKRNRKIIQVWKSGLLGGTEMINFLC